jgi:hypothetical protein
MNPVNRNLIPRDQAPVLFGYPRRTHLLRGRGSQLPRYLQPHLSPLCPLRQKVRTARATLIVEETRRMS